MRELEFLPEEYLMARAHRRLGFLRSWLLVVVGLSMALWSLQMGFWVRDARAELQALRGTGHAVEADCEKVRRLQAEARAYSRRSEALEALASGVRVADLVAEVADRLPEDVSLEAVRVESAGREGARVTLCGQAPTEVAVTRAATALEGSSALAAVVLVESTEGGEGRGNRQFVIECRTCGAAKGDGN